MVNYFNDMMLDQLIEGFQIISPDYKYLYINEASSRQVTKPKRALLGYKMQEVYPEIENTPVFFAIQSCLKNKIPIEIENELSCQDGQIKWLNIRVEPVPEGVFILSFDVTKRKLAEINLQNQTQCQEALREIDVSVASTSNLAFTLRTILFQVTNALKVDAADILLFNPQSMKLEYKAGRGFCSRKIESSRFHLKKGNFANPAKIQNSLFIPDLSNHKEGSIRFSLIEDERFISYCAEPLNTKGKLVGVMEVFHRSPLKPNKSWFDFLKMLAGQASLAIASSQLFQELKALTADLIFAYETTIEGWSRALDLRDKEPEGHTLRVTEMTVKLARLAGIPEEEIIHIRRGALLHDIGKLGIPDSILLKPEDLTEEEWNIIRKHPTYAHELINPIEYLRPALPIPSFHHEKWDGSGYPLGLKGNQIPLSARLFAVADVWDSLSCERPYRKPWQEEKVLDYIQKKSKTHFDPIAVSLFMSGINKKSGN
jgi:HD-GYP domain-containing protein (c-di-GMP phosphodiesterase class II)